MLASGGEDGMIHLWNVAREGRRRNVLLRTLEGKEGHVRSVAFHPNGRVLVSGEGRFVRLWDPRTGKDLGALGEEAQHGHTDWVWSVAFSPNGRLLTSGGADLRIKLWVVPADQRDVSKWQESREPLRSERPYEGMIIKDSAGLTPAQKETLRRLA